GSNADHRRQRGAVAHDAVFGVFPPGAEAGPHTLPNPTPAPQPLSGVTGACCSSRSGADGGDSRAAWQKDFTGKLREAAHWLRGWCGDRAERRSGSQQAPMPDSWSKRTRISASKSMKTVKLLVLLLLAASAVCGQQQNFPGV